MTQFISETALSDGISKLGKIVLAMSLTPILTCAAGVPCMHDCYACKHAYNVYRTTKEAWDRNYRLVLDGRYDVISKDIQNALDKGKHPYFRWFVGGDIPTAEFLSMMCDIAVRNPDVRFLCFTKKYDLVEEHIKDHGIPANLAMVLSCWKKYRPEAGPLDDFPRAYFNDETPECDLPYISFKCSGDCMECGHQCWDMVKHDNVVFDKH